MICSLMATSARLAGHPESTMERTSMETARRMDVPRRLEEWCGVGRMSAAWERSHRPPCGIVWCGRPQRKGPMRHGTTLPELMVVLTVVGVLVTVAVGRTNALRD